MTWNDQFLQLFRSCVEKYRSGNSDFHSYYEPEDLAFLKSIGYKPRELFDFVEDLVDGGEPTESTALLVAAVRRDYLHTVQNGQLSEKEVSSDDIPARGETLDNVAYFPRILAKARAKLAGELHPNLMYGCGGDRGFLRKHGDIHPADFLRHVWASGDDDAHMIEYLRQCYSQG
ncbi:hypothetical protein JIN77_13915 [Verrucomicrobiaceae bacterium R5-34]|uniref:DUF5069 domain-containing protein n=1 Tax=Oceaniferula flava TaxID=2800421 RepID=A0AAE2V8X3_9BACT|nr:DUF5069 domain-containing protein [Oceaniferula flavus]MBK1831827.1 hypothetical protein [Verrucomicrobiaceae bacterium R5-34]MBK1856152.1 hypothetical protein [Oceaniferula flavus]MBM1137459.1 hypothetical protein [Oceaniferula flavus]